MATGQLFSNEIVIEAAIEALIGLFFALVAVAIVYSTPLRDATSDMSQKLLLASGAPGGAMRLGGSRQQGDGWRPPSHWLFVDLGPNFCQGDKGTGGCPPSLVRTDRSKLATLLRSIRRCRPRLIVLDILIDRPATPAAEPGDSADPSRELVEALEEPGPPVLLSWGPREVEVPAAGGGRSTLVSHEDNFLPLSAKAKRNARYLPALRRLNGPTARFLTPDYDILDSQTGARGTSPGIAFGAAMIAADPDRAESNLDAFGAVRTSTAKAPTASCVRYPSQACLDAYRRTQRVFSFLPVRSDEGAETPSGPPKPNYLAPHGDGTDLSPSRLEDSIVVIGDSRASAGDRTWTAVGDASGSEVILNDIRQFLLADPAPDLSPGCEMLGEWPFFCLGFLALFLSSAFALRLWPRPHRDAGAAETLTDLWPAILRSTARLILSFVLATVFFAIFVRVRPVDNRSIPNFMAPFFALLLENLFEWLHRLAVGLHDGLHRLVRGLGPKPEAAQEGSVR